MIVAGLTGSIAMGKTETARLFALRGIPVFDSDAAVHQLYAKGGAAVEAISALVPEAILDGAVDRSRLSSAIRQNPRLLKAIEISVHPQVRVLQENFLEKARSAGCSLAILDIPLLFETGRDREVDKTIVVTTTPAIQRERALKRSGMTAEKLDFLVSKQMPDAEKRARADYIVDTSISFDDSQKQVDDILSELIGSAGPQHHARDHS